MIRSPTTIPAVDSSSPAFGPMVTAFTKPEGVEILQFCGTSAIKSRSRSLTYNSISTRPPAASLTSPQA